MMVRKISKWAFLVGLSACFAFLLVHSLFSLGWCLDTWAPGYDLGRCVFWFVN